MQDNNNEWNKCLAGKIYDCHHPVFLERKKKNRELLTLYNALPYDRKEEKTALLRQMLGGLGTKVSVGAPFLCDYGCNIHIGNNVSINMNCLFVDCNKITIGDNVLIAPNVQIHTATHPVEFEERFLSDECPGSDHYFRSTYALPVKIGNGCWLGGGVIVLPGITIGDRSVIGAGSVVTRDIPPDCVAAGNPCKILRKINGTRRHDQNGCL